MTIAATAAIGLGVALTRTGVQRRGRGPRRGRNGELGLERDETLAAGLRRMALEQTDVARDRLAAAEHGDARSAVHEARKAIKRLRTIVRLLEGELGGDTCAREQDALRSVASRLAGARDAEVMLSTLEDLVRRNRKQLAGRAGVLSVRLALARARDDAEQRVLEPRNRLLAADELRLFRARVVGWRLQERPATAAIEDGLLRVYRQGRKRYGRAAGKHGARMRTMHQWRKRVKDLRYGAEALRREGAGSKRSRKRGAARAETKWLRRLGERADALSELLGEEHDLAVLGEWISEHGAGAGAGPATRKRIAKLIARRRAKLRKKALRAGRGLYARKPRRFVSRVERAFRAS